jgi:hypothetical protein
MSKSPPQPAASPATASPKKSILSTRKQLAINCHKLALPLDEVKDCLTAAAAGKEYTPMKPGSDGGGGDRVTLEAAAASDADSAGGATVAPVAHEDQEDLTLTHKKNKADAAPAIDVAAPGGSGGLLVRLAHIGTWQALALWVLVLLVFLTVVPRILRLRKRARSGMRSE